MVDKSGQVAQARDVYLQDDKAKAAEVELMAKSQIILVDMVK